MEPMYLSGYLCIGSGHIENTSIEEHRLMRTK
jgi:hypothetical protein